MSRGRIPERLQVQKPWKQPLPGYIEQLSFKRFAKWHPEVVVSIEERARREEDKKALRRGMRLQTRRADDAQG